MWMQEILSARTRKYEWWKWCEDCEIREGCVHAEPCRKHGDPTAEKGRWGDDEEGQRTGRTARANGSDIHFLGGAGMVEDLLRCYHTRMEKTMMNQRRALKWCLHEQVWEAGNVLLESLLSEHYRPARRMDHERFYVTNMGFDDAEMPWGVEERKAEEEEEVQEEPAVSKLEQASSTWLETVGLFHSTFLDDIHI